VNRKLVLLSELVNLIPESGQERVDAKRLLSVPPDSVPALVDDRTQTRADRLLRAGEHLKLEALGVDLHETRRLIAMDVKRVYGDCPHLGGLSRGPRIGS
jgi:hypothetical protein